MLSLMRKKKEDMHSSSSTPDVNKRVSIRDKLLVKEARTYPFSQDFHANQRRVQEMEQTMPATCRVTFNNPNQLHEFNLAISPDEGYWLGGRFSFHIFISEEYNMAPPVVKCLTKLWHPNISEEGDICLSLLRQNSIDGMGWAPTRKLKDVIWGLNSLFTDLLNFDDPLNIVAAELYLKNKDAFIDKVREYVVQYAKR